MGDITYWQPYDVACKLLSKIFLNFFSGNLKLNEIDAEDPEISDYNMIPDTSRLSESVRVCLQESDEIPADYTRLFEQRLFSISTQLVPSAIRAYEQLGVKHEQLRLISPQFETPLPPLAAAVFPPTFRELTNPQVFLSLKPVNRFWTLNCWQDFK